MRYRVSINGQAQPRIIEADTMSFVHCSDPSSGLIVSFHQHRPNPRYIPPSRRNDIPDDPEEEMFDADNWEHRSSTMQTMISVMTNVREVVEDGE